MSTRDRRIANSPRTSFRSREQQVLITIFGCFGSSVIGLLGAALAAQPGVGLAYLPFLVAAAFGFFITYRLARSGARADASGLTIVNPRRRITVPWNELDRFEIGDKGPWTRVGLAHLHDGSTITIWGIQGPNPVTRPKNTRAEDLIDELNARLQHERLGKAVGGFPPDVPLDVKG